MLHRPFRIRVEDAWGNRITRRVKHPCFHNTDFYPLLSLRVGVHLRCLLDCLFAVVAVFFRQKYGRGSSK